MIVLTPRQVNEVSNLGWVVRNWASGRVAAATDDRAPRSKFGNINIDCTPHSSRSLLLPASDGAFFTHIEPGVRRLVAAFVALGLITYTSCEGHDYDEGTPDERHVGLVIRTLDEKERVLELWNSIGTSVGGLAAAQSCELGYMDHSLACGDRRVRALDLYIVKRPNAGWEGYFRDVDDMSAAVADALLSGPGWQAAAQADAYRG